MEAVSTALSLLLPFSVGVACLVFWRLDRDLTWLPLALFMAVILADNVIDAYTTPTPAARNVLLWLKIAIAIVWVVVNRRARRQNRIRSTPVADR